MRERKYSQFKIGETVVYPKHGVGEITKIESMKLSNIKSKFYVVKMEQAKLIIRVPLEKQQEIGLRKLSSKKKLKKFIISSNQNQKYGELCGVEERKNMKLRYIQEILQKLQK